MAIFEGLNENQLLAVNTIDGPVRLIAGAGSGKTRTVTHRVAHLVEVGVKPASILAITFTNKAANEMKHRIRKMVGEKADDITISTYHAFCAQLIRQNADKLVDFSSKYKIIDGDDQRSVLRKIYKKLEIDSNVIEYQVAKDYISEQKGRNVSIDDIYDEAGNDKTEITKAEIYESYINYQKENNLLDFGDLLIYAVRILRDNQDVREKVSGRYKYIHVDEFQDTDNVQFELVKLLASVHKNVMVVGDPDQTIYTWRGANAEIITDFDKHFENVKTITLDVNYRSTKKILNLANTLIVNNDFRLEKNLITENEMGEDAQIYEGYTEDDEASWIATKVNALIENGANPSEILVLFRSSFLSRALEQAFMTESIPFKVIGGTRFFERAEIKDALAYLQMIISQDDVSFERIINLPKRGIGGTKFQQIQDMAAEKNTTMFDIISNFQDSVSFNASQKVKVNEFIELINNAKESITKMKPAEFAKKILVDSGYMEMIETDSKNTARVDNINEFLHSIEMASKVNTEFNFEDYLNDIALDSDDEVEDQNTISIMTIHKAKGLEADYVFIFGMNDGVFPSWRSSSDKLELEEERRLAYVAITRAKKNLFITCTKSKPKSRFIYEMGSEGIKEGEFDSKSWTNEEVIYHDTFGKGTIIETSGDIITIDFGGSVGLKTMLSNHKSLKRVK